MTTQEVRTLANYMDHRDAGWRGMLIEDWHRAAAADEAVAQVEAGAVKGRAARHKHWFHGLWYNLGPYGRQDVHIHPCGKAAEAGDCDRVLVGEGRDCKGPSQKHWRATLPLERP